MQLFRKQEATPTSEPSHFLEKVSEMFDFNVSGSNVVFHALFHDAFKFLQHPHTPKHMRAFHFILVFSVTDLCIGIRFCLSTLYPWLGNDSACMRFALITQFTFTASELWYSLSIFDKSYSRPFVISVPVTHPP